MIYVFKFVSDKKNKYNSSNEFTLTAETKAQFYSRVQSQYGVFKDNVEILREVNEDDIDVNWSNKDGKKESKLHNRRNKK